MHKVDSSGATAQNEFTNGNPATQTPRTRLEAKYMNTLQRELIRLVEQRGAALSDTDDHQLSKGIVLWLDGGAAAIRQLPIPTGIVTIFERGSLARAYWWDAASSVADDGITVVRPSSNPATGRWRLAQFNENLIGSYSWSRLSGVPSSFPPSAHGHPWGDLSGVPSSFPPSSHGHSWGDLTGIPSAFPAAVTSGTFIATLQGVIADANSSGTATWWRIANLIAIRFPPIRGTANSSSVTIGGFPNDLRPAVFSYVGAFTFAFGASGGEEFAKLGISQFPNQSCTVYDGQTDPVFTSGGLVGTFHNFCVTYAI